MVTLLCGWCKHATAADPCSACGHADPAAPWVQRGQPAPVVPDAPGRPGLDPASVRRRLREARASLGVDATQAQLADALGISARTLARWQKVAG